MIVSQNEDIKNALDELNKAINDTESLRLQLDVIKILAEQQMREINSLRKLRNTNSIILIGGGLTIFGLTYLADSSVINNVIRYSALSMSLCGGVTYIIKR